LTDIQKTADALRWLAGDSDAVKALEAVAVDVAAVAAERDAAVNRSKALEEALSRSQAAAASLATIIAQVREDAADGVLDNPVPEDPSTEAPADEAPVA